MNREESFFKTTMIRDANGFDLMAYFKRMAAKDAPTSNTYLEASYYAALVAECFELKEIQKDLMQCFYRFIQNEWSRNNYRRYHVGRIKTILGEKEYRRAVKVFKKSRIKETLTKAGFNRIGLLTFINMVNYAIYKLSYET